MKKRYGPWTDAPEGHPIQVVSRRTGLTPDVLRTWEKRYGAVMPSRTDGMRRLYSDEDIERLILLRKATMGGRGIGQIASLPTDRLRALLAEDEQAAASAPTAPPAGPVSPAARPGPADAGAHRRECFDAIEALDASRLETALARATTDLGQVALLDQVLSPLIHSLGDHWREGTLRVAHEHVASTVIRTFLGGLSSAAETSLRAPELLVTTPAGQAHELGAMLAAAAAASEGWRVTFLGASLPAEEIAAAARTREARAVALSLVYPTDDPRLIGELRRLRSLLPPVVAILAGGRGIAAYRPVLEEIGALQPAGLAEFRVALESLRSSPRGA